MREHWVNHWRNYSTSSPWYVSYLSIGWMESIYPTAENLTPFTPFSALCCMACTKLLLIPFSRWCIGFSSRITMSHPVFGCLVQKIQSPFAWMAVILESRRSAWIRSFPVDFRVSPAAASCGLSSIYLDRQILSGLGCWNLGWSHNLLAGELIWLHYRHQVLVLII